MNASEWNQKHFDERMRGMNNPPSAAISEPIFRTVPGTNNTLQVSTCGTLLHTSLYNIMNNKKGVDVTQDYSEEQIAEFIAKTFPLESEERV